MTPRIDECPNCGTERTELVVVPGRFYCPSCGLAGVGPSAGKTAKQLALDLRA